jgi:signal transduction histidine kinase
LLDNAIKYNRAGGSVSIKAREGGNQTVIAIEDNGIGIPAQEVPRIWDRLHRGDESRSQPGLGLGLSLVKAVVQAHKGRIDVRSEPGNGSTFTIIFPKPADGAATELRADE